MSEGWENYYTQDEIKRIQKIEMDTLKVFDDICKKLGIDYFLYGGSLLGAIKYNGFVPWDDDLDVALMRKDYELLISRGRELVPDGYELQHPKTNTKTPYPYIKFRYKNSTMVEYVNHSIKMNHGIYFDIYPIDNISDVEAEIEKERQLLSTITEEFQIRQSALPYSKPRGLKAYIKAFIRLFKHVLLQFKPRDYFITEIDRIMTLHNTEDTRFQGNLFFPHPTNYFDGIFPLITVKFEDMEVKIPKGYMMNLTNRYGDISVLPPECDRVGHKPYCFKIGGEMYDN